MPSAPIVFISSTEEDLRDYRKQAHDAVEACGFHPDMMEYFPTSGQPSLEECRRRVAKAELVIVIVAHRYGWAPADPGNDAAKSITWLECEHAWKVTGKEVLAFLMHPDHPWPAEKKENYRIVQALGEPDEILLALKEEVGRNVRNLEAFKNELKRNPVQYFTTPESLRSKVSEALLHWKERHPSVVTAVAGDPEKYLRLLEEETRELRIRGLKSKRSEPYHFPIDDVYIPLTTAAGAKDDGSEQRRMALEQATTERRVVLIGEPGAGKSTFLRRMAFELCRTLRETRPADAKPFLAPGDRRFPILIRISDLARVLAADRSPKPPDAPDWIPYFLGKLNEEFKWGLSEEFFQRKLAEGGCLLMLDGLDEAPDDAMRERLARLFEQASSAFDQCDFLVTTRPLSYAGDTVLKDFPSPRIDDLEIDQIRFFFEHFTRALGLSETEANQFKADLEAALRDRPEIRTMARNPVMLTALAVLQHNDQKLPDYRVELYDSILKWLAAAHEHVEGRVKASTHLLAMRKLALAMQCRPGGRLTQIERRKAAEILSEPLASPVDRAMEILEDETQDAGIVAAAGSEIKFAHLSFQEYLAAREIASFEEKLLRETIQRDGNLYKAEWREVMRLLAGYLCLEGKSRIEWLVKAILEAADPNPGLAGQARCVGLIGAMMRDLARMENRPEVEKYERMARAVMCIFEAGEAEKIDFRTRLEAAEALGQVGDPRLDEDNRVTIPVGSFWMGAQTTNKKGRNYDPEAYGDEGPVHEVKLKAFRIARYPVTVQEYEAFLLDKEYENREWWEEGFGKFTEPDGWERQKEHRNRPVVGVSWFEAAAYCKWSGGRLPAEAEWERAARGSLGGKYPWGEESPLDETRANYDGNVGHPTPVGLYPKGNTTDGLSDMLGNVYEWCSDWFAKYEDQSQNNPPGPGTGSARVLRGCSWFLGSQYARVSYRVRYVPAFRYDDIGFRWAGDLR